jgi:hypothetical protein
MKDNQLYYGKEIPELMFNNKIRKKLLQEYTSFQTPSLYPISALGNGLDDQGSRVRFPVGAGKFSLHHRSQNGSGAHPASYPMSTRCSFPGDRVTGV